MECITGGGCDSSCSGPSNAWGPVPKQFSLKLKSLFFLQCIGYLAFSTTHFNPVTSLSYVTLARTHGSFHLGQMSQRICV
jgi:hypothetical protein